MCVIIDMPAGKDPPAFLFEEAFRDNPHGWGILTPAAADGGLIVRRGMTLDDFFVSYNEMKGAEMSIHFRTKTHGAISLENCHPFQLLSTEKHGADAFLMHNGVIHGTSSIAGLNSASDTLEFVKGELAPVLESVGNKAADLLTSEPFHKFVESRIGVSRLLIAVSIGGIALRYHLGDWHEKDGVMFSNRSLLNVTDPPKSYRQGGFGRGEVYDPDWKMWVDGEDDLYGGHDGFGWGYSNALHRTSERVSETRIIGQHIKDTGDALRLASASNGGSTRVVPFHPKTPGANLIRTGQSVGGRNLDASAVHPSKRSRRRAARLARGPKKVETASTTKDDDTLRDMEHLRQSLMGTGMSLSTRKVIVAMIDGVAFAPLDLIKADLMSIRYVMRAYPTLTATAMAKTMTSFVNKLTSVFPMETNVKVIKLLMEQDPKEDPYIALAAVIKARSHRTEIAQPTEAAPE